LADRAEVVGRIPLDADATKVDESWYVAENGDTAI
jgi:hypothetical protein